MVTSIPVEILPAGQGWKVGGSSWKIENGTFNVLTQDYSLTHNYRRSGSGPARYRIKPLVSYQTYRQLSGWDFHPLVICAVGAH